MNQEKYKLNWHTYSDHLREMLDGMLSSQELSDVTLVCDDKMQYKAHKIVLSACSTVFKSIIKDLPQHCSVIYLRGVQHQEMEPLLDFMYLGVANFYQERMNEFLNVARSLEIKKICEDVEFNEKYTNNYESDIADHEIESVMKAKTDADEKRNNATSSNIHFKAQQQHLKNYILTRNDDGMFECNRCNYLTERRKNINEHILAKHEGVKYDCSQCKYQATKQDNLKRHMQYAHEGVKYNCNLCYYKATTKGNLKYHIQNKHEGITYDCNLCKHQATTKGNLKNHIQNKHGAINQTERQDNPTIGMLVL